MSHAESNHLIFLINCGYKELFRQLKRVNIRILKGIPPGSHNTLIIDGIYDVFLFGYMQSL